MLPLDFSFDRNLLHNFSFYSSFEFPSSLNLFRINLISDKKKKIKYLSRSITVYFWSLIYIINILKRLESDKKLHSRCLIFWEVSALNLGWFSKSIFFSLDVLLAVLCVCEVWILITPSFSLSFIFFSFSSKNRWCFESLCSQHAAHPAESTA